jgi:hypothetical protein
VDVEVAEQDLLRRCARERRGGTLLIEGARRHHLLGDADLGQLAGTFVRAVESQPGSGHVQQNDQHNQPDERQHALRDRHHVPPFC